MATYCDSVELTPNPVVASGIRLGRDELIAAGWSAFWTTVAKGIFLLIGHETLPLPVQALLLAVIGPLTEKPGLVSCYIAAARRQYRATPAAERQPLGFYVKLAWKEGWPTLRADLLFHDPSYIVLLWLLLHTVPQAGPATVALLSAVSFVTAVVIASGLDVLAVHLMYRRLLSRLNRAGFVTKRYYEARFLVDPEGDERYAPERVLDRLQAHFRLPVRAVHTYRDIYLTGHSLAVYNGRKPYLRFRQRLNDDGSVSKQAVQVLFTRAREVGGGTPGLYRCFATLKEKAGYDFPPDQPMPWRAGDIPDPGVARLVRRLADAGERREVCFSRYVAMEPDGLFVSIDKPPQIAAPAGAYWLELKSRTDVAALRAASDYIAWKLPVRATTRTKCDAWTEQEPGTEEKARKASDE